MLPRPLRRLRRLMKPSQVKVGSTYAARVGGWLFDVTDLTWDDALDCWAIHYTVLQTGQHCQATPAEFTARVSRALDLDAIPNRKPGARP